MLVQDVHGLTAASSLERELFLSLTSPSSPLKSDRLAKQSLPQQMNLCTLYTYVAPFHTCSPLNLHKDLSLMQEYLIKKNKDFVPIMLFVLFSVGMCVLCNVAHDFADIMIPATSASEKTGTMNM